LRDIAGLVGPDALQDADRLLLESARNVQELVLGQSAHDPEDAFSTVGKTYHLVRLAIEAHRQGLAVITGGGRFDQLQLGPVRRALAAMRSAPPAALEARIHDARQAISQIGGVVR
jgi:V/A-type H+-transporting ATPase subunit A